MTLIQEGINKTYDYIQNGKYKENNSKPLIHLISIPVTNTSVNPARSTAVAVFVGGAALKQLWLFWVAPILGGVIGGFAYKMICEKK